MPKSQILIRKEVASHLMVCARVFTKQVFPYFCIFTAFIREQISHPWADLSIVMLINDYDFEDQINILLVYMVLIFILSKTEDIKLLTCKNIFNVLNVTQPFLSKELPLSCYAH